MERGHLPEKRRAFVIDEAKASRAAIEGVFGELGEVRPAGNRRSTTKPGTTSSRFHHLCASSCLAPANSFIKAQNLFQWSQRNLGPFSRLAWASTSICRHRVEICSRTYFFLGASDDENR